jgi:Mrp family chromosome partitioning ATPase
MEDTFHPAFGVEAFEWPVVCESLISKLSESLDDVAKRLSDSARRGCQVVCVTGSHRGEGRTTALLCIARRLAAAGHGVVMVDADFQHPRLADYLGLDVPAGWESVLRGDIPTSEATVLSRTDQLALLPLAHRVSDAEGLAKGLLSSISLGVLRQHFHIVLVDLGPLLDSDARAAALTLAERAGIDAALLVHDVRRRDEHIVLGVAQPLARAGVPVLGVVETYVRSTLATEMQAL